MSDSMNTDTCGDIRIAGHPPSVVLNNQSVDQYSLPLPAGNVETAQRFLEGLGGDVGGGIGAGMAATGCIIFGVASAGWGLLACGVVGGLAGGIAGSYAAGAAADSIFYTDADKQSANHAQVQVSIEIPAHRLYRTIPETLCRR